LWRNVDLADETALPYFAVGVRVRLADFSGFENLNAIVSPAPENRTRPAETAPSSPGAQHKA
jgi:hypothetical protein